MRTLSIIIMALTTACNAVNLGSAVAEIDPSDAEDIAPGSAEGEAFAGTYLVSSFDVTTCECAKGSKERFGCDNIGLGAEALLVEQTDGALSLFPMTRGEVVPNVEFHGGINGDGSFNAGGNPNVSDGTMDVGKSTYLVSGTIEPEDRLDSSWTTRLQFVVDDETFDCRVDVEMAALFWKPEEGDACSFDTDCHPDIPICTQQRCQDGSAGDPCNLDNACGPDAPVCIDEVCRALGTNGDTCRFESDCQDGLICDFGMTCQPG